MSTYAFVFVGLGDWKISLADDWELSIVELEGNEKTLGHHKIDGSICKVVQSSDGKVVGLTK